MEYISELLIFVVTFLLVWMLMARCQSCNSLPPGPCPLPIIGNLYSFMRSRSLYRTLLELRDVYGDIYSIRLGAFQAVVITGFDNIHEAFVTNSAATIGRPKALFNIQRFVRGKGIVFQDGEPWRAMRRFTLSTLRDLGLGKQSIEEKILEESTALNNEIDKYIGKEWTDSKDLLNMVTSNIICSLIFGSRFEYNDETFQTILQKLKAGLFQSTRPFNIQGFIPIMKYLPTWIRRRPPFVDFVEHLKVVVNEAIEQHRQTYDVTNLRDYIDGYIKVTSEGSEILTEEDMLSGILDLFMAGTETTSTTLAWSLLYMMEFPEIQRRCQEEVDQVVGRNRQVRMVDKENLPYVEATCQEIQRHASIIAVAPMHLVEEDIKVGGYNLPKNVIIMAHLYSALRDTKHWDQPDLFSPERFLTSHGEVKKISAFIPFSTGPRVCLGENLARMEIFLFFSNILHQFTVSKVDARDAWLETEVAPTLIRSTAKYRLRVERRD